MKRKQRGGAPWRQLAGLGVVVLGAHMVLLERVPLRLERPRGAPVEFLTRVIAPAPVPAAAPIAVTANAPPPPPAPAPRRAPRAVAPRPTPAALPEVAAEPEVAPAPAPEPPLALEPPAPAPATASGGRAGGLSAAVAQATPAPVPDATPFAPQVLAIPEPAHLHFDVSATYRGIPLSGKARLDWQHDAQQYEARLEITSAFGGRIERSTGRITEEGLAPDYYAAKANRRSEEATHFDRANGHLVFSNNRPDAVIAEGVQDRLSLLVQLSVLVAGQPAKFPPGTRIAIPTADTREAENWVFEVEGEEDLDLPGGRLRALKLQRLPRKEFDQKVELWLAPRLDYAPVRLRLTNPNGDTVDNRWSSTDKG